MVPKKDIRRQIASLRRSVTDEEVVSMSLSVTAKILEMPAYRRAERIMAYMDYNHEVVTRYLIEEAWKDGKEVAIPRVEGDHMDFYRITDFDHLEKSTYGIAEPPRSEEQIDWEQALMIMPGVAFDRMVNRVGYGGGYYDRYLAEHPHLQRLAIAFSFQILPEVPTEPTDICPQIIVTEKEILYRRDLS